MKGKILVLYYHDFGFPMMKTNTDMLYCFEKYSTHLVFCVNVFFGIPAFLLNEMKFDLVVYHDLMLCKRTMARRLSKIKKETEVLKSVKVKKIAIIQDEFTHTNILNEYLVEHSISHIFTCADASELPKIYPQLLGKIKFNQFFTGYMDDQSIATVESIARNIPERTIDIGYRASYNKRFSLGSHGMLKGRIADVFQEHGKKAGLKMDISTHSKDGFKGLDWYRFLLSSKYTLGVESGASILDDDGSIADRVSDYVRKHPNAAYEEAEKACFPGKDGNLKLFTIGPRHFEACMTRTCQILVEGNYSGVLEPWKHYLPVKKDFGNVDEILSIVKEDKLRSKIVEQAYEDIVCSGKYTYRYFVEYVLNNSLGANYVWSEILDGEYRAHQKNLQRETRQLKYVGVRTFIISKILDNLPEQARHMVEDFMKKSPR